MTPDEQAIADIRDRLTRVEAAIDERLRPDITGIRVDLTILENSRVSVEQFQPIQKLVYGVVGLTLIAVFTAILALVVRAS